MRLGGLTEYIWRSAVDEGKATRRIRAAVELVGLKRVLHKVAEEAYHRFRDGDEEDETARRVVLGLTDLLEKLED